MYTKLWEIKQYFYGKSHPSGLIAKLLLWQFLQINQNEIPLMKNE